MWRDDPRRPRTLSVIGDYIDYLHRVVGDGHPLNRMRFGFPDWLTGLRFGEHYRPLEDLCPHLVGTCDSIG
jgi:hypothetical protein